MFIWRQLFPPNMFFGIMCLSHHPWPPFFSPFLIPLSRGWFWVVHHEGLPSLIHDSQVFLSTLRPLKSPVTAIWGENELVWEGNQLLCTNGKGQIRLSGPLLSSKRTRGHLTGTSGGHCCVCYSTQMGWDEWWELGLRGKSTKEPQLREMFGDLGGSGQGQRLPAWPMDRTDSIYNPISILFQNKYMLIVGNLENSATTRKDISHKPAMVDAL